MYNVFKGVFFFFHFGELLISQMMTTLKDSNNYFIMTTYFGTIMASTLHYLICEWLLIAAKGKNIKVLLLNTELVFKDMTKEEIHAKF